MPWTKNDASKHTKKADTAKEKSAWTKVANETLKKTGSDAKAVRLANYVVKKMK